MHRIVSGGYIHNYKRKTLVQSRGSSARKRRFRPYPYPDTKRATVRMIEYHLTRAKPKTVTYSSNTHRGHSHALVPATQLSQGCDNLAGTGSAQGVTKSTVTCQNEAKVWGEIRHDLHGTTTRVHLALIQTQLVDTVDTLIEESVEEYHPIASFEHTIEAKASLISKISISSLFRPNLPRILGIAKEGPMPMIRGSRPATVAPQNLPTIG